jgi:phytoene dehydrogenase-like protein
MNGKKAGFPIGGSLEFAKTIERRFTDLGGKIVYGSRAEKVLEISGRATGVRFKGGETAEADYIVSALDLRKSLYSLLDGSRIDPAHEELLAHGKLYEPAIVVSFGSRMSFDRDISCIGTSYELETPITIAGREQRYFAIKNYSYDPGFAPRGKSVVGTMIPTDWEYWEKLSGNKDAYAAEKKKILDACIGQIESRYPGFASSIEESDVATPLTFERYTGNWKGSYMTWQLSQDFQRRHRFVPKTVPGLSGFYIASMWTSPPGGIPGAATAGRGVVQIICKQDKKRFVTSPA